MGKIIRIDTLHHGDKHKCSANGSGIRIVIWFCGCDIRCNGCHNKEFWEFNNPVFEDFSQTHIDLINNELNNYPNIYSGISILGGEPFSIHNINDSIKLCQKYISSNHKGNIWIWSGHTLDWLQKQKGEYGDKINQLLKLVDYLVDGPFDINKRNISLRFRGSTNQIIWEKDKEGNWIKSNLN